MGIDLALLEVQRVIVHEVPGKRGAAEAAVRLSEVESTLGQNLSLYIKERIIEYTGTNVAYMAVFDDASTSPIPRLITDYLTNGLPDFVSMSQVVANHLYQIQSGVNTSGLVLVVDARIGDRPCVAILKVEREQGVRFEEEEIDGKRTFNFEHIRTLMLSEGIRVYKAGIFVCNGVTQQDIEAQIADMQRGRSSSYAVAKFFLSTFLGCKLRESPEITTKRFCDITEAFINEHISDPGQKARYQVALLAEMNNQRSILSPTNFAVVNFAPTDHPLYFDRLRANDIPTEQFPKDLSLVGSRIKNMQIVFEGGISVIAPADAFDTEIQLSPSVDGRTKVQFEAELRETKGRR